MRLMGRYVKADGKIGVFIPNKTNLRGGSTEQRLRDLAKLGDTLGRMSKPKLRRELEDDELCKTLKMALRHVAWAIADAELICVSETAEDR